MIGFFDQVTKQPPDFRKMTEDLSDADHGQVPGIYNRVATGGAHFLAADAEELECGAGALRDRLQRRSRMVPTLSYQQ
jgi:hypothetical protein